jgi:hypothetical protein
MAPVSRDDSDISCRALHVALSAVQLYIAWHSGVITGNAAMAALGQEFDPHHASVARTVEDEAESRS